MLPGRSAGRKVGSVAGPSSACCTLAVITITESIDMWAPPSLHEPRSECAGSSPTFNEEDSGQALIPNVFNALGVGHARSAWSG